MSRSISEPDEPTPVPEDPAPEVTTPVEAGREEGLVEGVVAPPSLGPEIEPVYEGFLEGDESPVEGDDITGELTLFTGRGT